MDGPAGPRGQTTTQRAAAVGARAARRTPLRRLHPGPAVPHLPGEEIVLNYSGAPIRDAAGQIVGGVIVFRDVTRQHPLEQQFLSVEEAAYVGKLVAQSRLTDASWDTGAQKASRPQE